MKKALLIILFTAFFVTMAGPSLAQQDQEQTIACPQVITENHETRCIDGYQWLVWYAPFGCRTYMVPAAQKFEIVYKRNGKPKMALPIPCDAPHEE